MKVRSRPLFDGCALEEDWQAVKDGQVLFTARVVRAYDAATFAGNRKPLDRLPFGNCHRVAPDLS
jgi:hypothetical protein